MSFSVSVGGTNVSVSVTGGIGPQGPAGSGGTAAGTVVNGLTGSIAIVGSGISVAASGTTITLTSSAAVSSVNGKTGAVTLAAVDVTAAAAAHLHHADDITAGLLNRDRLPVATTKALGAVQASSGLAVDDNGHLSANVRSVAGRTGDVTLATTDIASFTAAAAAAAPVQSVQGRTGAVVLSVSDVTAAAAAHTHATTDIALFTTAAAAAAPVQSVQGRTGAVSLVATDLTAAAATHQHAAGDITSGVLDAARLPVATATAVGAASVSSGLSITAGGALSANVRSVAGRTGDVTLSGSDVSGVVTSLNSLSGAVAIAAGSNITVAAGGTTVSISSTGGGSPGGVTSVAAVTGSVTITAFGFATSTSGQAITFDARPVRTSPAAFTSSQNDYNPGAGDIFRLVNGTTNTLDITGFATTSMSLEALVINVSTHTSSLIRFRHQNTNSTAVNRIISPWGGDVVLASGGTAGHGAAVLVYDVSDSRWRVT